jgi:hypothetical protein
MESQDRQHPAARHSVSGGEFAESLHERRGVNRVEVQGIDGAEQGRAAGTPAHLPASTYGQPAGCTSTSSPSSRIQLGECRWQAATASSVHIQQSGAAPLQRSRWAFRLPAPKTHTDDASAVGKHPLRSSTALESSSSSSSTPKQTDTCRGGWPARTGSRFAPRSQSLCTHFSKESWPCKRMGSRMHNESMIGSWATRAKDYSPPE